MFDCEPFSWKCAWREMKRDFNLMDKARTWARLILLLAMIATVNACIEFMMR